MATKYTMIDFQHLRTNQVLQLILTDQYIKMYGNVMAYTIVGRQAINEMQQNLILQTNNALMF